MEERGGVTVGLPRVAAEMYAPCCIRRAQRLPKFPDRVAVARNEIFALKPAPIQVSYMGFPCTTGATYIDYLVTDEFVSPLRYAHIFYEKIVCLLHCYFVNKNQDV